MQSKEQYSSDYLEETSEEKRDRLAHDIDVNVSILVKQESINQKRLE